MNDVTRDIIRPTWINGVSKVGVQEYHGQAVVANGVATFYLTDDGTANGNPIFSAVFNESVSIFVPSTSEMFVKSFVVSADKKTLSATINRLGTVLAGIIQIVSAANGTIAYLSVKGQ